MNNNMTIDRCAPDFKDVAAATLYSVLLVSLMMTVI
jgi:hypothetical protein